MYQGRIKNLNPLPALLGVAILATCNFAHAADATTVFSYPNGFAGATGAFHAVPMAASFSGSEMLVTNGVPGEHEAAAVWYSTQQNITAFTTSFTFKLGTSGLTPIISGLTFCIQNSNTTTNPTDEYGPHSGINASTDANLLGYGAYVPYGQHPIGKSIAIKFDLAANSNWEITYPAGSTPSGTGLYIDGGPSAALFPEQDLNPSKISLYSGHIMAATVVYDGALLTMTLRDTSTNAQFRTSWPVNIPAIVGSNTAFIGFTSGEITPVQNEVLSWEFSSGINSRVATPSFSVAPGSYPSAQSVSLSAPSGSTIYYTTNGTAPTTSSAQYSGPISVNASEVVQAVAVQSGYTDSLVAIANYQIAPAGTPLINFPNGFAGAQNLISNVGTSVVNGSALRLTDTGLRGQQGSAEEVGAAWYVVPVSVASFTTHFALQITTPYGMGMTFCIQNQNPASTDTSSQFVSGGPYALGNQTGFGYSGTTGQGGQVAGFNTSAALVFDINSGSGDLVGLYTNGANPFGSSVDMSSSGVVLKSGHPINVTLVYNGSTLSLTATDSVTNASFTHSWAIDIPNIVAGNTAYVGFTGSTYWGGADQDVKSWTYATTSTATAAPVPAAPTNLQVH